MFSLSRRLARTCGLMSAECHLLLVIGLQVMHPGNVAELLIDAEVDAGCYGRLEK
jgi:hypothetical protein